MSKRKEAIDADVATPAEIESLLNALKQAAGQPQTDAQKRTPMWAEATTIQTNGHWDGKTAQPDAKQERKALANAIEASLDYLHNHEYNPFEPDNQTPAFDVVVKLSGHLAPILAALRQPQTDALKIAREIPAAALDALRNGQKQIDADGEMVGVSRQALDEVLAALEQSK